MLRSCSIRATASSSHASPSSSALTSGSGFPLPPGSQRRAVVVDRPDGGIVGPVAGVDR